MRKLIMLTLLAAGIAAVVALPATAKPRGINGKIVFNADNVATGQEQVYTVDPDGSDLQLLASDAEAGQWSPEGMSILVNGGILNFDTRSFTDLSLGTLYPDLFLGCGVWSPDGERLACEGLSFEVDPTLNGIYTVRSSDGSDLQRVTSAPFGDDCPSDYSPNGNRIVFTGAIVKIDGSGVRRITPAEMFLDFCSGSWSPQGNEIVFSTHVPDFNYRSSIWVVHSDGTGLRQIPVAGCGGLRSDPNSIGCQQPRWSPDGQKIVFGRHLLIPDDHFDLYTVNADGSGLFQVTNTPDLNEFNGDWGTHPVTP
jgi:Tol biopolymer transport system component